MTDNIEQVKRIVTNSFGYALMTGANEEGVRLNWGASADICTPDEDARRTST